MVTVAALAAIVVGAAAVLAVARFRKRHGSGLDRHVHETTVPPRWNDTRDAQRDALWDDPSMWSEDAERAFAGARRRAERDARRLLAHRSRLLDFSDVVGTGRTLNPVDRGLQTVPLAQVVGSIDKPDSFTRSFDPRSDDLRGRWKRAYAVAHGLRGYHPVELYKLDDDYFVLDGHFRISVTKALGGDTVRARVLEWT